MQAISRSAPRFRPAVAALSRRALAVAAVGAGLALLAGCGFHPVDARGPSGTAATAETARIDVKPIRDRTGQIMRTELRRRFNPTGLDVDPAYTLKVTYVIERINRATRYDDSAVRVDIQVTATFDLNAVIDKDVGEKRLLHGTSQSVARKNNTDSLYAAHVSEEEATKRATELVAEDIARQVSLYFLYPDSYTAPPTPKSPYSRPTERPERP